MADKKLSFHDRTHSVCHTVIITGNRSCEIVYFFATLQYVSGMMPIIIDPSTTRVIIDGTNGKECEVLDTTSEGEKGIAANIILYEVCSMDKWINVIYIHARSGLQTHVTVCIGILTMPVLDDHTIHCYNTLFHIAL